jgi:beta-glucosidase-like glycosyl hydrolase
MEGALRGRGPGRAAVAAITAGCDALLYPSDAIAVAAALDRAAADQAVRVRIDAAVDRVARLAESVLRPAVSEPDLAENRRFADATADLAVHTLRGDSLQLVEPLAITVVDDDVGGPYSVGPRDVFARALRPMGVRLGAGGSKVTLVYAEPRSWKSRASLGQRSLGALGQTPADLVILLGHPRLVAQIPGDAPVVCAWHGNGLMQQAAARWVSHRFR